MDNTMQLTEQPFSVTLKAISGDTAQSNSETVHASNFMKRSRDLDDLVNLMQISYDRAFKMGLVEYASQIARIMTKVQTEADYLYDKGMGI